MGVTTKDLAKICKVSRTTVVRALNNQKGISDKTRQMIVDKAKELGYRPDLLAKGLVQGKTMNIGVVVFDVKNRYFAQLLNGIENEAKAHGYFVNITLHEKNKEQERKLIQRLVDYRVDGLILSPVSKDEEFAEFLRGLGTPFVIIGNKVTDYIPYVGIDEQKASETAVQKIAAAGYEKVAFVCPPLCDAKKENIYSHEQREKGFMQKMKKYPNMEPTVIGTWDYVDRAVQFVEREEKKTAFFCSGDIFALDIMKHLRAHGKRAPRDYGIMGFDNIDILKYIEPRLSTVDNAVEEVGKQAVHLLLSSFEGNEIPMRSIVDYVTVDGGTI